MGGSSRPLTRRSLFPLKRSPPKWINRSSFREPLVESGSVTWRPRVIRVVRQKNSHSGAIQHIAISGMLSLKFQWDPKKAASNVTKHQVTFDEAQTVFLDEDALVIPDPEHSAVDARFVILGQSAMNRAL